MLYFHLANLPQQSLAGEIFAIQERNPSLWGIKKDLKEPLEKLGNPDPKQFSKYQWKRLIRKFIQEENRTGLLTKMKSYKKLSYNQCK